MNSPVAKKCPDDNEQRFATRETAARAARNNRIFSDADNDPYECVCGWWHIRKISRPPKKFRRSK